MNKNKMLLLVSSIGVFVMLAAAAIDENFLKGWRRIQTAGRNEGGAIPVQLRQVVNPGLRSADRCVSCHVAMGPGEEGVTGDPLFKKHPAVIHDPAVYGCTVCHGGQGSATEKADAHGDVHFWPEPMVPVKMAEAGCGSCHIAGGVASSAGFREARNTFERLDCLSCHRVDGRGGALRPGGVVMEGGDLSAAGLRGYDTAWHDKHAAKTAEAEQWSPWKTFQPVPEGDRALVARYLATRVAAPKLVAAKATFFSYGCLGCHRVSGVGGDEGPDLTRSGEKDPGQADFTHVPEQHGMNNWIAEHFRAPGAVVAGSKMPPVYAPEEDIRDLTMFVLSLRRRELPGAYVPKDRIEVARFGKREFAADGATIFGAFCAGCHGPDGLGLNTGDEVFPSIAHPEFHKIATDRFLTETIAKGRPGRRMPGWDKEGGLRPDEIAAVVRHLRAMAGAAARTEEDPWRTSGEAKAGEQIFAASCAGCHGNKGQGAKGPALANPALLKVASDGFLRDTIANGRPGSVMPAFSQPSPVHRTLTPQDIESLVAYIRKWR